MSRIKEVEDQIPKHFSKYIQDKMRKHLLKDYYARKRNSNKTGEEE